MGDETMLVEKECKACHQKILNKAIRCHHCGSPQNLFAKLNQMSLVLSVIATTFSLIALSAPIFNEFFIAKKSDVQVSVIEGLGANIQFAIFNAGNAPTAIKQAQVSYTTSDGDLVTHVLEGEIDQVIEPNKVIYVKARSASNTFLPIMLYPGLKSNINITLPQVCTLEVIHNDFNGKELLNPKKYECIAG